MQTAKEVVRFWSSEYDNLKTYIDQKYNDFYSLVQSFYESVKDLDSKYTTIMHLVTQINDKLTEDVVDELSNFGTPEDFKQGLYDAFGES